LTGGRERSLATEIVTTWFGVFAVREGRVLEARPFPADPRLIRERWQQRRRGELTPEERDLLEALKPGDPQGWVSRDRRFLAHGVSPASGFVPEIDPRTYGIPTEWERDLSLQEAERDLQESWDPSVHLDEAVRALSDLDSVLNELGGRIVSWAGRGTQRSTGDLDTARREAREWLGSTPLPDPRAEKTVFAVPLHLAQARQRLAEAFLAADKARADLQAAIEEDVPAHFPNLTSLLGPLLTARLVSQAGGLARLARFPASTIQVLGAERAFFDHLRGEGPPPRHGLLFLHPDVHSAPRAWRGKIARALAGKVAIAARRDLQKSPVLDRLRGEYEARRDAIRKLPLKPGKRTHRSSSRRERRG